MNVEKCIDFYNRYFDQMRGFAYSILKDYYLAGDVVQDVYMEMFRKSEGLDESKVLTWLKVNTKRRAIDYLRKSYRKHEVVKGEEAAYILEHICDTHEEYQPEKCAICNEEKSFCNMILDELAEEKPHWFQLLADHYMGGMSYKDMVEHHGKPANYLRVETSRARAYLYKKLKEKYRED